MDKEPRETIPEVIERLQGLLDRHDNFSDSDGWLPLSAEVQYALESAVATLAHLRGLTEALREAQDKLAALRSASKPVTNYSKAWIGR